MTIAIVALLGTLIGVSMGFSGIGGFLVVPLMIIVADAAVPQAVFTALAANLGVTLSNGLFALGKGQIDWRPFNFMLVGSGVGAFAGIWLLDVLSPEAARYIIAVFLAVLGLTTIFFGKSPVAGNDRALPGPGVIALGVIAQVSAVLVGIGGPAITVPVLSARSASADRVVGTALLHGAFVSALGLVVTRQAGADVDWLVVFVAALIVVSSLVASFFWRTKILAVVSLRPVVGVLALVGAAVLVFLR